MDNPLDQYRDSHHEFKQDGEINISENPFDVFNEWFALADESNELEANAFVLGTSSLDGQSSTRIVYLKEIVEDQFVFYTNYNSQKGKEMEANPKVSLLFFYPKMSRQIRIEGECIKVDEAISDAYFDSRPRGSKIGAWASNQSDELSTMDELTNRVAEFDEKFPNEVPRPPHWGGYQIRPTRFEFWVGKSSRLHERIVYEPIELGWKLSRKNP